MLKKHKNALLEAIIKSGFDPTLFHAEESKPIIKLSSSFLIATLQELIGISKVATPIFTIKLRNTSFKFYARHISDSFDEFSYKYTAFMPGYPEMSWRKAKGIEELLREFNSWLSIWAKQYIQEQQLPDLWTKIEIYKPLVNDTDITDENTSNFSEEEKEHLRRSVREFRASVIENFNPSQSQVEFINDQLNYLSKAVDRLNRFDWRALAISTLIGIAINLSVDTEKGHLLFRLFQQAFQTAGRLLQ
jgi:hypothetical protein